MVPDGVLKQTVVTVTGALVGGAVTPLTGAVVGVVVAVDGEVVTVTGTVVTGLALAATKPVRTAAVAPALTKTVWVARRTRAKRRSRC